MDKDLSAEIEGLMNRMPELTIFEANMLALANYQNKQLKLILNQLKIIDKSIENLNPNSFTES